MFNSGKTSDKSRLAPDATTTVLGEGTHWQGEINAGSNGLLIEGSVEGTILSVGLVVVAPSGVVNGTIQARHLTVRGRVEGIFRVEERLEIQGTGWVEGEVELGTLVVDEGGTLQGTCMRRLPAKPKEAVPLVPRREDALPERPAPPASGTHGGHDPHPPRGFDRNRF